MICKKCDELLALYERAVNLYTIAARSITGTIGDDFVRAMSEAERLKLGCREASDNLMMHWRQRHSNLALASPPRGILTEMRSLSRSLARSAR
jgi:hypothetical protein